MNFSIAGSSAALKPLPSLMLSPDLHAEPKPFQLSIMSDRGLLLLNKTNDKVMSNNFQCCREGQGTNWKVTRDVGAQMMNAFVAYDEGNYSNCVVLMKPLKYDILKIGGSNAQVRERIKIISCYNNNKLFALNELIAKHSSISPYLWS